MCVYRGSGRRARRMKRIHRDPVLGGPRTYTEFPDGRLDLREWNAWLNEQIRVLNENANQYAQLQAEVFGHVRYAVASLPVQCMWWKHMAIRLECDAQHWESEAVWEYWHTYHWEVWRTRKYRVRNESCKAANACLKRSKQEP